MLFLQIRKGFGEVHDDSNQIFDEFLYENPEYELTYGVHSEKP